MKIRDKSRRKVCVVLVDRANYGRMRPVMQALKDDPAIKLQVVCAGTMLLERFGAAIHQVERDGFQVDVCVYLELEGSQPISMAKSVGIGAMEFASAYQWLKPDLVLLIGDRYEAMAATVAAAYMNLQVAHIQGGEVSGSIDESTRHAITKFSHLHFPSTERAASYIRRMGEPAESVHNVGCPAGDYILSLDDDLPADVFARVSVGADVRPDAPYLLVIFHPVTTEIQSQARQVEELLAGLEQFGMPTVWLWPNIDAGADQISKVLRKYREHNNDSWLCLLKNLDPVSFQKALRGAACAVGNSSSFVRDSTFSGTPVVLVGNRQQGREFGQNLVECEPERNAVFEAVKTQIAHGRYEPDGLYGNGTASKQIVEHIKAFQPTRQKRLSYIFE